jgi:hypothetical protein
MRRRPRRITATPANVGKKTPGQVERNTVRSQLAVRRRRVTSTAGLLSLASGQLAPHGTRPTRERR